MAKGISILIWLIIYHFMLFVCFSVACYLKYDLNKIKYILVVY